MFNSLWQKIIFVGIKSDYSQSLVLKITNTNRLLFLVFLVGIGNFILDSYKALFEYCLFDLAATIFVLFLFCLNYFSLHKLSRHLFMVFLNLIVFIAASVDGRNTGLLLFFLPLMLVGIFVIGIEERKNLNFYIFLSVILLLVVILTDYNLFLEEKLSKDEVQFLFWESTVNLITFTAYGLYNIIEINRKMEIHLLKEKANLDAIFNSSLFNILLLDKNRKILAFNNLASSFIKNGYDRILQIGDDALDYIATEDRNEFLHIFQKALNGQVIHLEKKIKSKLGEVWYEIHFSPKLNEVYQIDGIIFSAIEITQRKKSEIAIRLGRRRAEAANIAKSLFLSTMSHEIRTPMNAVIGMTGILLEDNPRDDQIQNLKILKVSSENLLVLLNNILDFNKVNSEKVEMEEIEFSLTQFVSTISNFFSPLIQDKSISFIVKYDERIPTIIIGDSVRLSQIVTNLISNAIKFTKEGHICFEVQLEEEEAEFVNVGFSVQDTGIGISEKSFHSIFENFSNTKRETTEKYGFTGLGLAITKKLLEFQNSNLFVESELGRGSKFYFTIKFRRLKDSKNVELSLDKRKGIFETDLLNGVRLLLVDDYPINQIVVSEFLSKWNVVIDSADNGIQALEKIENSNYDIILMDLQMPDLDGYETTRRIRAMENSKNSKIPIIAITASSISEIKEQVLDAGMNDCIAKPFEPEDLFTKLIKYTENKHE